MLSTTTNPTDVIMRLRGQRYRTRTALWLVPSRVWGHEPEEAARLGIHAADAREPILATLAPDQKWLGLDADRIIAVLESIVATPSHTDCSLVYNFDLLIARLRHQARATLWETIYSRYPHRRPLLIAMPHGASALLPDERQLDLWRRDGRLAE